MSKSLGYRLLLRRIKESFFILPQSFRKRLAVVTGAQVFLSIFDLAALFLIASLSALAVTGIQSLPAGSFSQSTLEILGISTMTFQIQVAILGSLTASLLVIKTVLSAYLNYKAFYFMSTVSAVISADVVAKFVSGTFSDVKKRNSQTILYALSQGISSISVGIIGNIVSLVSDLTLLLIMLFGISSLDPIVGMFTLCFFGLVAIVSTSATHSKTTEIARKLVDENISINTSIIKVLKMFREIFARGLISEYTSEINKAKFRIAKLQAGQAFLPFIGKYAMELSVIVGGLTLTALQFATKNAAEAISGLAVFLLASSRLSPAVLRFQQALIQIRGSVAGSQVTFELIDELRTRGASNEISKLLTTSHKKFKSKIVFDDVTFSFPDSNEPLLKNIDVLIEEGEIVSIVGPSGTGKSSFVDLILGQLVPTSGEISVSDLPPRAAQESFPGAIAYVPQDIYLFEGTLRDNVLLGLSNELFDDKKIWRALKKSELDSWVKNSGLGLDMVIAEAGVNVSGGQKQRIGIARALITNPKILILDEATSSLDRTTEQEIARTISKLRGKTTVLSIAHRVAMVEISSRVLKVSRYGIFESSNF